MWYLGDRGDRYGGLSNRTGCEGLPDDLVGGCYWRFNWARGEVNNWDVTYRPISCPYEITSVSGCSA